MCQNSFCFSRLQISSISALAYGPPDNFTSVPSACLLWNTRKERIVEQILSHNPDIICLQEVDHYEDFFLPLFNDLGYQGFFFPKKESPCLKMEGNNGPDGVSLFYRDARLDIVDVHMRYLRNADKEECSQPVVTCMLFDKVHLKNICVAVTHLKAKQGFEGLRAAQAKDLLQAVDDIRRKIDNKSAVAICGDFNGQPHEECYSVMENHPDLRLESAYKNLMKSEIPYTTWKIRDVEKKKTIDYIWINPDKVGVAACLAAPSEEDVPKERFPSFSCPSDHIALCCDFTLL